MANKVLTEIPDGYLVGTVTGRDLRHLVTPAPFNDVAVCGVQVFSPSIVDALYFPTAVCGKCLKGIQPAH